MGLILLRYGEIGLKGANRPQFVRQLRRNVRACLLEEGLQGEVWSHGQRLYVRTDNVEGALELLSRVFGLVSLSPVAEVPRDIEAIVAGAVEQAKRAGVAPGVKYRVATRRSDKTFAFISPEINRLAGAAIKDSLGGEVDLSPAADVVIGIEVSREGALIYARTVRGPGGLPLNTQGRVVALLSGGIDSPVAAWMMMRRGCGVIPLHFSQNPEETAKAMDNLEVLRKYSYGWQLRPIVLDHNAILAPVIDRLQEIDEERWSCVFCKRLLLQKAAEICDQLQAQAIVMGDALGQVASQTLGNIEAISYGISKPILRPLIGMDKNEIVALARRIGTFEISTRSEHVCPFLPPHPITRGSSQRMLQVAERLGMGR